MIALFRPLRATGARAVSLGSCMDDLRRSPSFIKPTPTCRIDLLKKQGGNSISSVLQHHKSHGGIPHGIGDAMVNAMSLSNTRGGHSSNLVGPSVPKLYYTGITVYFNINSICYCLKQFFNVLNCDNIERQ